MKQQSLTQTLNYYGQSCLLMCGAEAMCQDLPRQLGIDMFMLLSEINPDTSTAEDFTLLLLRLMKAYPNVTQTQLLDLHAEIVKIIGDYGDRILQEIAGGQRDVS
jgi:hypothetical protein